MKRLACIAGLAILSVAANAQVWSDNFDSYANGTQLHGVGGWTGWDNLLAAGATVSNAQSSSAPHSVDIHGASDLVQQYVGFNAGQYTYSTEVYVPTAFTGESYFLLLNDYNHGGPYNWSVQLRFTATTNMLTSDLGAGSIAFTRGVWHSLKVDIDLTANTKRVVFNGTQFAGGVWSSGAGSNLALEAVDLYANNATAVYYDNMSVPEPATLVAVGLGLAILLKRRSK
jgi:hypothetical protein